MRPRRLVHARFLLVLALIAAAPTSVAAAGKADPAGSDIRESLVDPRPATTTRIRGTEDKQGTLDGRLARPEDHVRAAFDKPMALFDPQTYVDAERALLEQLTGTKIIDPRRRLDGSSESRLADTRQFIDRIGSPGGDMTGDDLQDTFELEVTITEHEDWDWDLSFAARGLRGTDGSQLWRREIGAPWDLLAVPVADSDGDARDDVLLASFSVDSELVQGTCAVVACAIAAGFEYHWDLEILSGANGATLWHRRYDGEATEGFALASAVAAFAIEDVFTATNFAVLPLPHADVDDDGGTDFAVSAIDLTAAFGLESVGILVGSFSYHENYLFATRAELVSGATGEASLTRATAYQPGLAVLLPAGNLVGDAEADLLWETQNYISTPLACVFALVVGRCAYTEATTIDLEAIDGSSSRTAWQRTSANPTQRYAFAEPTTDLTGDGRADLVLLRWVGSTIEVAAISGADGAEAWSYVTEGDTIAAVPAPLGSVDGGAGDDVLVTEIAWGSSLDVSFVRLDGETGLSLLRTDHTSDPDAWWTDVFTYVSGDSDGDGVKEVVMDEYSVYDERADYRFISESGRTGAPIATAAGDADRKLVVALGDLSGDGLVDLSHFDLAARRAAQAVVMTGERLPAQSTLWSREDRFLSDVITYIQGGPDQTGAGGDDLIISRWQIRPGLYENRVESFEGTTGSMTWFGGDPFTAPPTPGTASFSGRVTAPDGSPLANICVTPYVDGFALNPEVTDADGRYTMTELSAGVYRARIHSCGGGLWKSEWFNDKGSIATADPIPVADASNTPGIDAVLEPIPAAVNDMIADALTIEIPYEDTRSTAAATEEPGEADECSIGATVWYRFTATEDATVAFSTAGSDFDTTIAVWQGSEAPSIFIGCNDDSETGLASYLEADLTAGSTYWLQAGGWFGDRGVLQLQISPI